MTEYLSRRVEPEAFKEYLQLETREYMRLYKVTGAEMYREAALDLERQIESLYNTGV